MKNIGAEWHELSFHSPLEMIVSLGHPTWEKIGWGPLGDKQLGLVGIFIFEFSIGRNYLILPWIFIGISLFWVLTFSIARPRSEHIHFFLLSSFWPKISFGCRYKKKIRIPSLGSNNGIRTQMFLKKNRCKIMCSILCKKRILKCKFCSEISILTWLMTKTPLSFDKSRSYLKRVSLNLRTHFKMLIWISTVLEVSLFYFSKLDIST